MRNYKELYEDLIARAKSELKFFNHESGEYYRKIYADICPEFFMEEEVRRSKAGP